MIVVNNRDREYKLTPNEEEFLKAVMRLEKLKPGRLILFGNGTLDVRLGGRSAYRVIHSTLIPCEGGDGGDNFD